VNGFSDDSFRPDDPILRQQLAKMLVLAQLRLADENYSKVQGHSTQTPTYSYPLGYLKTASAAVYLPWNEALGAGALSTITRLELAMALAPIGDGILEPPRSTYRLPFLDVPASAAKDVALLDFNGVLSATGPTTFSPDALAATRGQTARAIGLMLRPQQKVNLPPGVTTTTAP
jgi:hypothetical protein